MQQYFWMCRVVLRVYTNRTYADKITETQIRERKLTQYVLLHIYHYQYMLYHNEIVSEYLERFSIKELKGFPTK